MKVKIKKKFSTKYNKDGVKETAVIYGDRVILPELFLDNIVHGDNLNTLKSIPDNKINLRMLCNSNLFP